MAFRNNHSEIKAKISPRQLANAKHIDTSGIKWCRIDMGTPCVPSQDCSDCPGITIIDGQNTSFVPIDAMIARTLSLRPINAGS